MIRRAQKNSMNPPPHSQLLERPIKFTPSLFESYKYTGDLWVIYFVIFTLSLSLTHF